LGLPELGSQDGGLCSKSVQLIEVLTSLVLSFTGPLLKGGHRAHITIVLITQIIFPPNRVRQVLLELRLNSLSILDSISMLLNLLRQALVHVLQLSVLHFELLLGLQLALTKGTLRSSVLRLALVLRLIVCGLATGLRAWRYDGGAARWSVT
jgi:hypothetical protein